MDGLDLEKASARAGHSSTSQTADTYAHLSEEAEEEMAEVSARMFAGGETPVSPAEVSLSGSWMGEGVWSSGSDTDNITLPLTLYEASGGSRSGHGRYSNESAGAPSLSTDEELLARSCGNC